MGLGRFELPTPRLSSVCSNQLSYRPVYLKSTALARRSLEIPYLLPKFQRTRGISLVLSKLDRHALTKPSLVARSIFQEPTVSLTDYSACVLFGFSRKEVIQPQVLLQLPCYDFTPITDHTLGTCLPCGLAQLLLVQPAFVM